MLKHLNKVMSRTRNVFPRRKLCTEISFSDKVSNRLAENGHVVQRLVQLSMQENGLAAIRIIHPSILREVLRSAVFMQPEQKLLFVEKGLRPTVDRIIKIVGRFNPSVKRTQWPYTAYFFLRKLTCSYPDDRVLQCIGVERFAHLTDCLVIPLLHTFDCVYANMLLSCAFKLEYSSSVKPLFSAETRTNLVQLFKRFLDLCDQNENITHGNIIELLHSAYLLAKVPVPQTDLEISKILRLLSFCKKCNNVELILWAMVLLKLHEAANQNVLVAEHLNLWLKKWLECRQTDNRDRGFNRKLSLIFMDLCLQFDRVDLLEQLRSYLLEMLRNSSESNEDYRTKIRDMCQRRLNQGTPRSVDRKLMIELVYALSDF